MNLVSTIPACLYTVVALAGLWLAGCTKGPPASPAQASAAGVTVAVIDEVAFAEVLRQHGGKVVLVEYWATWCLPCREFFPHTVELHKRLSDKGLVVISVSLDDPQQESSVRQFLAATGATFENFISAYGTGSKSMHAFRIEGGVPCFQLYDRNGKLHKTFASGEGGIDPVAIDRVIAELL